MKMRNRIREYFSKMVEAGNRISSARFFMLVCLCIAVIMYSVIALVFAYDGLVDGRVDTDLEGLSSLMNAVGINLGVGGATKVLSRDKVERRESDGDIG